MVLFLCLYSTNRVLNSCSFLAHYKQTVPENQISYLFAKSPKQRTGRDKLFDKQNGQQHARVHRRICAARHQRIIKLAALGWGRSTWFVFLFHTAHWLALLCVRTSAHTHTYSHALQVTYTSPTRHRTRTGSQFLKNIKCTHLPCSPRNPQLYHTTDTSICSQPGTWGSDCVLCKTCRILFQKQRDKCTKHTVHAGNRRRFAARGRQEKERTRDRQKKQRENRAQQFFSGRDHEDDNCNAAGAHRRAAKENISLIFHGNTVTHMDAFSHFFWEGKMYNGRFVSKRVLFWTEKRELSTRRRQRKSCREKSTGLNFISSVRPSSLVTSQHGATKNSAEAWHEGIVTRGVLLDIQKLRGRPLNGGEGIFQKVCGVCSKILSWWKSGERVTDKTTVEKNMTDVLLFFVSSCIMVYVRT